MEEEESGPSNSDTPAHDVQEEVHQLVAMLQIVDKLRAKKLDREGINLPLVLAVTDSAGRASCSPASLEPLGGSKLWPPNCSPPVPVILCSRGCRDGESVSYVVECGTWRMEAPTRTQFRAQIAAAFRHLVNLADEVRPEPESPDKQRELSADAITVRLRCGLHLGLENVIFRWEHGDPPEGEAEISYIEYKLRDIRVVRVVKWTELQGAMGEARTAMRHLSVNTSVYSDMILFRTVSSAAHSIPLHFKFDSCPSAPDPEDTIQYAGHQPRRIMDWRYIRREIEIARLDLECGSARRKSNHRLLSPIVLQVREPTAADLIRVDLSETVQRDLEAGLGFFSSSVAHAVARSMDGEPDQPLLLGNLCEGVDGSNQFVQLLSGLLRGFAIVKTSKEDMVAAVVQEVKQKLMVVEDQIEDLPSPVRVHSTTLETQAELEKVQEAIFQDLEMGLLSGGLSTPPNDQSMHYAFNIHSMFSSYTDGLPPHQLLQFTSGLKAASSGRVMVDACSPLKFVQLLDKVMERSTSLVDHLHQQTKLFVSCTFQKHLQFYPYLLSKYTQALEFSLNEGSAAGRELIDYILEEERTVVLGFEIEGLGLLSGDQVSARYNTLLHKIATRLRHLFNDFVDTHLKTKVNQTTNPPSDITFELSHLAKEKLQDLKNRQQLLQNSILDLSHHHDTDLTTGFT